MPRPPVDSKLEPHRPKLGKIPDDEISRLAGVSRSAVVNYRKRLGIPAYEGYKFVAGQQRPAGAGRKTQDEAPAKPAAKAAAKPARAAKAEKPAAAPAPAPVPAPAAEKPAKPAKASKGGRPAKAAKSAPVVAPAPAPAPKVEAPKPAPAPAPASTPAPAAAKRAARQGEFHGRRSKLDPFSDLLGKVADAVIAAKAGVTVENVRAYRTRRGIAGVKAAEVTAVAAPPAVEAAKAAPAPVKAEAAKPAKAEATKAAPAPAPVKAEATKPAPAKAEAAKPAPAPAPVKAEATKPAPAPAKVEAAKAAPRAAFLVTVDEGGEHRNYAVLANDIADAARAAVDGVGGRGTVRAVSKVADLL